MNEASYDVITFDCYGTLIDWGSGILGAFAEVLAEPGRPRDGAAILEAYHAIEPRVESGPFRPYREVLAETASRVLETIGRPIDADRAGFLAESLPAWPPFDDTGPALRRLAASGYRLGILSNVDADLLEGTLGRLPDVFDRTLIVTAGDVGSYKPSLGHFEEARRRIGGRRWLHAAQSLYHDVRPASAAGIPVAWVNRLGEARPDDLAGPTIEVPSLAVLAEVLARR